ncbi:hypothetical protein [Piscinibacter sp.]|uniref:hypothetical protein n=1 Tax=Piscinibacter sp. TaxID=1903157 RepID=UPI0039E3D6DD
MSALRLVIRAARARRWRPQWWPILAVLLDVTGWLGIALLCALWTRVDAAELPRPGAVCAYGEQRATVQFLEPGEAMAIPWAWVALDADDGWTWRRVRVDELRGCR